MTGLICLALTVARLVLLARVVVSWLEFFGVRPPVTGPSDRRTISSRGDRPVLRPLRKVIPPAGMFDISVVVAFVIIFVLQVAFC